MLHVEFREEKRYEGSKRSLFQRRRSRRVEIQPWEAVYFLRKEKEADWEMWRMSRVGAGNAGSSQQMASIF